MKISKVKIQVLLKAQKADHNQWKPLSQCHMQSQ